MATRAELIDRLQEKLKYLFETTWEHRINLADVDRWLEQFQPNSDLEQDEQLHALFLATHFIYFGQAEIRELLRSLYRDLYRTPILHSIRRGNNNTTDVAFINSEYGKALERTRFLGVGNPSESGVHLLYYFRQENNLPKSLFINTHEIFKREQQSGSLRLEVRDPNIEYYVFIDDICGSGTQATQYSNELVEPLKSENPNAKVLYFVLFATTQGLAAIRSLQRFDQVAAVFELDESFRSLETSSRIFNPEEPPFIRERIKATCLKYGQKIWPSHPLGYKNGQLLIGFSHNTPDNALPIFWGTRANGGAWVPLFRRYHKDYG